MDKTGQLSGKPMLKLPDDVIKALHEKDKIIKVQAKRINLLQNENGKLRKERDTLHTKLTLLSYKLHLMNSTASETDNEGGAATGGAVSSSQSSRRSPLEGGGVPTSGPGHGLPPSTVGGRKRSNSGVSSQLRKLKQLEEQDKLKKSRAWANAYELSQDLHDKQLEMLERKYGGQLRARRAARIIQQAYRQYCMNKNFAKLKVESEERRLSRRFAEFGRSKTIWSDMVNNIEKEMGLQARFYSTEDMNNMASSNSDTNHQGSMFTRSEDNRNQNVAVHTEYVQTSSSSRAVRVMHKSHSLQITAKDRKFQRSLGLDLGTIRENSRLTKVKPPVVPPIDLSLDNNNRNSYPELNDSSASDSPQDTPVEPHVDLPSVNFENLLESKETDILNDSFHSDSSQEVLTPHQGLTPLMSPVSSHEHNVTLGESQNSSSHHHHTSRTYEHFHTQYSDSTLHSHGVQGAPTDSSGKHLYNHHSHIAQQQEAATTRTQIPIQGAGAAIYTKVPLYDNSEVRLRKQWTSGSAPENNGNGGGNNMPIATASAETLGAPPPPPHPQQSQTKKGTSGKEISPIWKRKNSNGDMVGLGEDTKRMSNISETSEPDSDRKSMGSLDRHSMGSLDERGSRDGLSSQGSDTASLGSHDGMMGNTYHRSLPSRHGGGGGQENTATLPRSSDRQRKRAYRIGLNLFNKKPEKGIKYLTERRFVDVRPLSVARFLISRKGLSKQMIGEYLGNLQKDFNMEVLECFSDEIDLSGLQVDMALRKFQSFFRMPGEAQKIERLMEAFANRYCQCNPDQTKKFRSLDSVFLLAFAIIMLNTDLHNKNIKQERKMKCTDFIRNLRGIDSGEDLDQDLLAGIYERIKQMEFKPGSDHVTQVVKVEQMIVGKKPVIVQNLALAHRRLVCYCRLYEVNDPNKREKLGLHQREVFLFNDMLLVTKIFSKKKSNVTYSYRQSFMLNGMQVYLFETPHYKFGVRLTTNIDGKVLITFNARNEHDRSKFVEDLKEAILEMNEMENQRIIDELHKQRVAQHPHQHGHAGHQNNFNRHSKDSGVVDIDMLRSNDPGVNRLSAPECSGMKKNTLSNSLIDLSEASRRGSGGSLDSGMASEGRGSQEDNSATCGMSPYTVLVASGGPLPPAAGGKGQTGRSVSASNVGNRLSGAKGKKTSKASLQGHSQGFSEV